MPQMAPLSWLTLFFYFSMIFFMFNASNYFMFSYNIKTSQSKKSETKLMTWQW
uniref:ATP synthase complex subunit 8 n=1 Tax=Micrambina sp. MIC01 TaxID=1227472 RepID=S4SVW9_9CUCU|nr:ATP synthase F0 subunit 8 [Micrambina sp. MIC01]